MKVLITCPRAPVTLEWIRLVHKSGCHITLVDSLEHPIGRFYDTSIPYVRVASPAIDFTVYKQQMLALLADMDWVIPNCEDVFYLAKLRESVPSKVTFFMPDNDLLYQLHNKFSFFNLLNTHVQRPETHLVTSLAEVKDDDNSILKPVFSRFGRDVIRGVQRDQLDHLVISPSYPWVQQRFIRGEHLCNYAVCQNGQVVAHSVYRPRYLLNQAAATYFEFCDDERLNNFITEFARENHYTGQVAFDFIDDGQELYVLECNPRATSGLHALGSHLKLDSDVGILLENTPQTQTCRVGMSLFVLFGIKALFKGELGRLWTDHHCARDVLQGLPARAQWLSFYEMVKRSLIYRKPLTHSTTFDIEYDGENHLCRKVSRKYYWRYLLSMRLSN